MLKGQNISDFEVKKWTYAMKPGELLAASMIDGVLIEFPVPGPGTHFMTFVEGGPWICYPTLEDAQEEMQGFVFIVCDKIREAELAQNTTEVERLEAFKASLHISEVYVADATSTPGLAPEKMD